MSKTYYIPRKDDKRLLWLECFNLKIIQHAEMLGITPEALLIVLNDTNAFIYMVSFKSSMKKAAKATNNFMKSMSNGPVSIIKQHYPTFVGPVVIPEEICYGIFPRTAILVRQIKANPDCSEAIAADLGIVGTDIDPAFAKAQPTLTLLFKANHVNGRYKKGQTHGILLESMRGDETAFSFLLSATKSTFIDKRPNLTAGKAETRHYRAWYVLNDEVIGQVSAEFKITVDG